MKVIDLLNNSPKTAFSFEILPPIKGNSFNKVCGIIDKLLEFDPKYINITTHTIQTKNISRFVFHRLSTIRIIITTILGNFIYIVTT